MSRLWDKGAPLDERVLRYTAGEDHALDNRLVAYDVRASIAHAEMLHEAGLLGAAGLDAIRDGLREIAESTTIPIAAGERLFTRWQFQELLEKRAVRIVQPDLAHAGRCRNTTRHFTRRDAGGAELGVQRFEFQRIL